MNELFVNIKVDREERPDIDQIYMAALHSARRAGRLAADHVPDARGRAVLGRHLFPKTARYGRPGFADVLTEIERLYRQRPRSAIETHAATDQRPYRARGPAPAAALRARSRRSRRRLDPRHHRSRAWRDCAARRNFPMRRSSISLARARGSGAEPA